MRDSFSLLLLLILEFLSTALNVFFFSILEAIYNYTIRVICEKIHRQFLLGTYN